MKRLMANHKQKKAILIALAAPLMFSPALLMAVTGTSEPVVAIRPAGANDPSVCSKSNPTTVDCCVLQQSTDDIRFLWR